METLEFIGIIRTDYHTLDLPTPANIHEYESH